MSNRRRVRRVVQQVGALDRARPIDWAFVDAEIERLLALPKDEFDREAAEVFGPDWARHVYGEGH